MALLTLTTGFASGQQLCPCVPLTHLWVVEVCETWNCAASATILANGDPYVLPIPASTNDGRWLVVKRVVAGGYAVPPDAPFVLETFDGASAASSRFAAVASDHAPMLLSAPDGKFLVIMLKEATQKKRAARP